MEGSCFNEYTIQIEYQAKLWHPKFSKNLLQGKMPPALQVTPQALYKAYS
jgi:hypothetical protein